MCPIFYDLHDKKLSKLRARSPDDSLKEADVYRDDVSLEKHDWILNSNEFFIKES